MAVEAIIFVVFRLLFSSPRKSSLHNGLQPSQGSRNQMQFILNDKAWRLSFATPRKFWGPSFQGSKANLSTVESNDGGAAYSCSSMTDIGNALFDLPKSHRISGQKKPKELDFRPVTWKIAGELFISFTFLETGLAPRTL